MPFKAPAFFVNRRADEVGEPAKACRACMLKSHVGVSLLCHINYEERAKAGVGACRCLV